MSVCTATRRRAVRPRCRVWLGAALALLALLAPSGFAAATALGEGDDVANQSAPTQGEMMEGQGALFAIERTDCRVEDAVCRTECSATSAKRDCAADPCSSRLMLCLATLPVGKAPQLPIACRPADQDAFGRLERQGELLDADPTLFAESYRSLIRARIACRAGDQGRALALYDEIMESLREKPVPGNAGSTARR
jgi:hypothetical protein